MRPRKKDRDLPAKVYRKHGAFYYVHQNKWERIGSTIEEAMEAYTRKVKAAKARHERWVKLQTCWAEAQPDANTRV